MTSVLTARYRCASDRDLKQPIGSTMALANAEKVRQYSERQKRKKSEELSKPEVHAEIVHRPCCSPFGGP